MHRITDLLKVLIVFVLLAPVSITLANQPITISVPVATNTDCTSAIPFCSSIVFHADTASDENCGFLWFQFELATEQFVDLSMTGCGANVFPASAVGEIGCACPVLSDIPGSTYSANLQSGLYFVVFRPCVAPPNPVNVSITVNSGIGCPMLPCDGCLPEPMLEEGREYIINAWVKKESAPIGTVDYGALSGQRPWIQVQCPIGTALAPCYPSMDQPIVEGWQPIECRFTAGGTSLRIELGVEAGTALYDDVRVFPADGSMKCYVYDPHDLRFVAELDERHYATFYEYDLEGKLVRVKKETERGIMTIQESRSNPSHRLP
jgi:hypothetical protein